MGTVAGRFLIFFSVFALGCTSGLITASGLVVSGSANYGTGFDGAVSITTPWTTASTYIDSAAQTRTFSYSNMISSYDAPTRKILTLASSFVTPNLIVGDEVLWIVMSAGTASTCAGSRGKYGFAKVTAVSSPSVTIDTALPAGVDPSNLPYSGSGHCLVQLVRVPNFSSLSIGGGTGSLSPAAYSSTSGGGVIAMRVSGILDFQSLSASINASSKGYPIPGNYSYPGSGQTESISVAQTTPNGMGGGGSIGILGSAGGGGYGAGGDSAASTSLGGLSIAECSGGSCPATQRVFFGGTAGLSAGYFVSSSGGIVIIAARNINGTAGALISADGGGGGTGGGSTATGGSGGGTILVLTQNATGSLTLSASGGVGASPSSAGNSGAGGGGGGQAQMYFCKSSGSFNTLVTLWRRVASVDLAPAA